MNRIGRCVRWLALTAVVAGLADIANAQQPAELRYKLAEGETLRYRVTQTATVASNAAGDAAKAGAFAMKTEQTTELAWKVTAVDEQGAATVEQTVEAIKYTITSPVGEVGFDSRSDEPPMGAAAMLAPAARTLLETPVTFTLSPTGGVGKITASDDLIESLGRIPGASEVVEGEPAIRAIIETVAPLLPQGDEPAVCDAVVETPSLGEQTLRTVYTLGPTEEAGVGRINVKLEAGSGAGFEVIESNGTALLAIETGRLVESTVSNKLRVTTAEGSTTIDQRTIVETVDDRKQEPAADASL